VLVAMSGGVDSSVAAMLLCRQGYEVGGCTMLLCADRRPGRDGDFHASAAVDDARRVAERLGIRHQVFDFRDIFRETVTEPFVDAYLRGETPNPCVLCNRDVKFGALLRRALELGFDHLATGHYARIARNEENGLFELRRSAATEKDQTYAFYTLTQEQLSHVLFPVGEMAKTQVRALAAELLPHVAEKPDSQEICFVQGESYAVFIERQGHAPPPGDFVDTDGAILGRHRGIHRYTVGQRKGLGAFGRPLYVTGIRADKDEVVLGENADAFASSADVDNLNWIIPPPGAEFAAEVKVRYNARAVPCAVRISRNGSSRILFTSPERAVTPGQAAVFYRGDVVLGGGTIRRGARTGISRP